MPALLAAAAAVGLGTGAAAALFLELYEAVRFWPAQDGRARLFSIALNRPLLVAIPALGGLVCGWIVSRFEPAARGTGTPELLHALRARGTPIRARYAAWKTLASVFTACSGGAAGPEAPMVTFGAGLAAWAGRRFKFSAHAERVLTAAGAAAGFAAVFDAPAAGTLFAVEVLLREVSPQALSAVILAAAAGTAIARLMLGPREFLRGAAAGAALRSPAELVFYLVLAAGAALFAKLFIETAIKIEKGFDHAIDEPGRPRGDGGTAARTAGTGPAAGARQQPPRSAAVVRLDGRRAAGVDRPAHSAVRQDARLPADRRFRRIGRYFHPVPIHGRRARRPRRAAACTAQFAWASSASAYMLVGMGAVFAAITLAPLTAIVLVLELTRNWGMALPLAVSAVAAAAIARAVEPESIDTRKLLKKGIKLREISDGWAVDSPAEAAGS